MSVEIYQTILNLPLKSADTTFHEWDGLKKSPPKNKYQPTNQTNKNNCSHSVNSEQKVEGKFHLISDHTCPGSVCGHASKTELIENFLMDQEMPSLSQMLVIFMYV